jgi:DNA-binding beta-propeller fold protein YncE
VTRRMVLTVLLMCLAATSKGEMQIEVVRILSSRADVRSHAAAIVGWLTGTPEPFLFERPYAVAWDGEAVVVTDPGAQRVVRIDGTRLTATPEGSLDQPIGVAACSSGILVSDTARGEIVRFDRKLRSPRVIARGIDRPTGIACRGNEIYVVATAEHRVLVLDAATGTTRAIGERGEGEAQFNFPAAIGVSGSSLFVGDTLNFRLQQIDAVTGAFRGAIGALGDGPGDTPRIKGIAVDSQDRLWVTDAHRDRISVFNSDGTFVAELGGPGNGAGEFSFPAGVAIHVDGRLLVADSLNRRVQVFRIKGELGR